jgi:hypothetical protein
MALRAYLMAADSEDVDAVDPRDLHIVDEASYRLPFLWLAPFRLKDVRNSKLYEDESLDPGYPIGFAPVQIALQQIRESRPTLQKMFADLGSLDDYLEWLHAGVQASGRLFVTIDWAEIAHDCPEEDSLLFQYALGALDGSVPLPVGRKAMLKLAEYDPALPFPPVDLGRASEPVKNEQWLAQAAIIGGIDQPPPRPAVRI